MNISSVGAVQPVGVPLEDYIQGIAMYTDSKNREYLYAAGGLYSLSTDADFGLAFTELGGANQPWTPAGTSSILYQCFDGVAKHLIFQNGENSYGIN